MDSIKNEDITQPTKPALPQRSNKLAGKVILITGGTSGLGAESAVALARHGAKKIYITGRGQNTLPDGIPPGAQSVIERINHEYEDYKLQSQESPIEAPILNSEKTEVILMQMDLSSLESVSAAADKILSPEGEGEQSAPRLDILLCNAGIAAVPYSTTTIKAPQNNQEERQGYEIETEIEIEIQFATNYLGHALLIRKLLPLLRKIADGGRIISVSSFAFRLAGLVPFFGLFELFDGFQLPISSNNRTGGNENGNRNKKKWIACDSFGLGNLTRWLRYGESKLALVVYTRELARRYPEDEVMSVCVTPGFVNTGMVRSMGVCDRLGTRLLAGATWALGVEGGASKGLVCPAEGAENQVWACLVEREGLRNGGVYDPVGRLCDEERLSRFAKDQDLAGGLWEWTEEVLGRWV